MGDEANYSAVDRLMELIQTGPVEYDIAILNDKFVLQDGHLGLNAGDLATLARDFRRAYRKDRKDLEPRTTSSSDALQLPQQELLKVTCCLLLVCPDHATAWADRKRALLALTREPSADQTMIWNNELRFLSLLMTKHTKAPTSWFHRKYTLQQLMLQDVSETYLVEVAREEIRICGNVAEKYPKNYYAWTHRIYVLQKLHAIIYKAEDGKAAPENQHTVFRDLVMSEWKSSQVWLRTHVSDHSAAHYGGSVLRLLVKIFVHNGEDERALDLLMEAVETTRRLVEKYPTHEVLWILRRICSHAFLVYLNEAHPDSMDDVSNSATAFWSQEILKLLADKPNQQDTNDLSLEATATEVYWWSYLAWVLEFLVRSHWSGKPSITRFGIKQEEVEKARETVLLTLRKMKTPISLILSNCTIYI